MPTNCSNNKQVNITKKIRPSGSMGTRESPSSVGTCITNDPIDIHVETDDISWLGDNFKCLDSDEEMFWTELISNYLEPLHHNEETKRLVAESLKELRNKVAFAFFFINGLNIISFDMDIDVFKHGIIFLFNCNA
jgi:hypothetical protein